MSTPRLVSALIMGAALSGLGAAALAVDKSTDPYWHKKPQAGAPKQAGTPAPQRTGVAKDEAAAKATYEKSRAGQADGELIRRPQHLQDNHNQ